MAKYKHTKTETEKLQIEGLFDATTLSFDIDGEDVSLSEKLKNFDGREVSIVITEKTNEDLE